MRAVLTPPSPSEYGSFYEKYITTVRAEDLADVLAAQPEILRAAAETLSEEAALRRYAPGKWSVKEVVGHLVDAERIFSYRALRIGRGDATPLAAFSENDYVAAADFDRMPMGDLVDDFSTARLQTLAILRSFVSDDLTRLGTASNHPISTRALFYIVGGHVRHHLRLLASHYGIPIAASEAPAEG